MARISDVIEGLQILQKYTSKDSHLIDAQHDVIYAGPSLDLLERKLSEEDRAKLKELGWHEDTEGDCWACFT